MKTLHVARRTPLDWIVLVARIVVGLTFVASGTLILIGVMDLSDIFSRLGAPDWMQPLVGLLQIAGGIGLLVPILSGAAAIGLALVMIGAALAELLTNTPPVAALIVFTVTALLAVALRARTIQLISALRSARRPKEGA
jgi:uncharacterized membrane protein YphA (DoxX/SURF4 family)